MQGSKKKVRELITTPEEGYEVLALMVIEEICEDYRAALIMKDRQMINSCERFLRGPRFQIYCQGKLDPEYLIKKIREEIDGN